LKQQTQAEVGEYRLAVRFPAEMGFRLKELADRNRRSINNEILCLVESGMKSASERTA